MNKSDNLYFYSFFFTSLIFIIFTNSYFNYEQSIMYGANDGLTYMQIAEAAPKLSSEKLVYHKAQRFIIPYVIGLISFSTNLEIFTVFRVCSFIVIIINLFIFLRIFHKLKININQQVYLVSILIFNPYFVRYFLSLPTLINDLVFIFSGTLLLLSLLENKKKIFYLAIILGSVTRINAIFYILAIVIAKIFLKKKFNFSFFEIGLSIFIFSIINLINSHHANIVGSESHANVNMYDLKIRFGLFFQDYSIREFLIFLFIPVFNFLPLGFLPFLFKLKFDFTSLIKDKTMLVSAIIFLMICFTAYMAGPITSGKNIVRLINLSYPFIVYIIFKLIVNDIIFINKIKKLIFFLFLVLWSLHPTYSIINIFNPLLQIFKY